MKGETLEKSWKRVWPSMKTENTNEDNNSLSESIENPSDTNNDLATILDNPNKLEYDTEIKDVEEKLAGGDYDAESINTLMTIKLSHL